MPTWPQKVANFSIFRDTYDLIGIADVTLPNITNLTDSWKGAGLAGETDVPIQAHFGPMSIVINWHVPNDMTMQLALQDGLTLDCWAAHQYHDSGVNQIQHRGWRFFFSTLPKGLNLGNLEVGVAGAASTELEVWALRGLYDDREQLLIDKEALICRVNGVDYARRIRQLIGRAA
jgi:P2 family phage contractile tail tube protein